MAGKIDSFQKSLVIGGTSTSPTPTPTPTSVEIARLDSKVIYVDAETTIIGEAIVGTATDQPGWLIMKRVSSATEDTFRYAEDGKFSLILDNHATYNFHELAEDPVIPPAPTQDPTKVLGNITMIGDSTFRGSDAGTFFSPAQRLGQLLTDSGYSYTWVGTASPAMPGSIPCSAQGGWTLADIQADLDVHLGSPPGINDLAVTTAIVSIGTNSIATAASGIAGYLDALVTAMGGLSSTKRIFVCAPVELGYFDDAAYASLTSNMQSWVTAHTYSYYLNLTSAGLVSADFVDGTHWTSAGANKVAGVIYNAINNPTVAAGNYTWSNAVINDMLLPAVSLIGSTQESRGVAAMGLYNNGLATPTYWKPDDQTLKSNTWWLAITPWWWGRAITGHTAVNSKIEVGKLVFMGRRKSDGQWVQIASAGPGWAGIYNPTGGAKVGNVTVVNGVIANYPTKVYNIPADSGTTGNTLHGGLGPQAVDGRQFSAIAWFMAARLTGSDTNLCNYVFSSGADWYPYQGFSVATGTKPMGWIPASARSGCKVLTTSWQYVACAPLVNPGRRGGDSNYPNRRPEDLIPNASLLAPNLPIPDPAVLPP